MIVRDVNLAGYERTVCFNIIVPIWWDVGILVLGRSYRTLHFPVDCVTRHQPGEHEYVAEVYQ